MSYRIIEQLLTPNKYSRPQMKLRCYKGIVIHWVANPNTSANANRNFFESRKDGTKSYGSAHEIIDLNGDVIICLPKNELAYHVGSDLSYKSGSTQIYTPLAWEKLNTNPSSKLKPYPNDCTYGLEATHIDWNGKMTNETYNTLVERCADLCIEFKLDPLKDIYTHQEVVGWKDCHRWFVNNPNEWKLFKEKVKKNMDVKLYPISEVDEEMTAAEKQAFQELRDTVVSLKKTIETLESHVPAPKWFSTEFGSGNLGGLISDPNLTTESWKTLAISLRTQGLGNGKKK